jgi:phosphatidate cytidylyltransferase
MADNKKAFLKRVASALIAGFILLGAGVYGGERGLLLVCSIAIVLGIREYARMAFTHWSMPSGVGVAFWLIGLFCYAGMFLKPEFNEIIFAGSAIGFVVSAMWVARGKVTNENLLAAIALGVFGLIYCVLFPYFAARTVQLEDGGQWFLFLMLVVFFGDTFAYFFGRWFGKEKFMPLISPNKTWAGSLGGLLGSALAGTVHVAATFQEVSAWKTVLFCLVCGFAAQSGDLLMSLVKRVAQVKDSGRLMPGHGGVLDRLDGIFIACPLVYAFALYVR